MPELAANVAQLFAGTLRELEDDGALTGIYKSPVKQALQLSKNGLDGDFQADRKHHGGLERALNHYPAEHYGHWRSLFPKRAGEFVPGMFGENLSTHGLTEENVCIGDAFRLGEALIQVSQPRAPCWKLSRNLGLPDLAKRVAQDGLSGWLYRVIEPGRVAAGDAIILEPGPRTTLHSPICDHSEMLASLT